MPKVVKITSQDKLDIGFRDKGKRIPVQNQLPASVSSILSESNSSSSVQIFKTVRIIAPVRTQKPKLRVAAYCRVSTLLDSQETSIEAQYSHYREFIRANPDWELAGIYLEAGVTGTKAEIRPKLQRLLADCKAGKIDLILTKSISRFSRSTSDCLEMVRELTALGVDISFEKEQISTSSMESEFMLSILACLAEDESHSISGNLKWGLRKRFENGTYRQASEPYGYRREGHEFVVVPEEAAVVREIFASVLSGVGMDTIARKLNRRGVPGRRGGRWNQPTIRQMVSNPVYIGDMLYQKTYTDETFTQRPNRGELDQYYQEGHHEAIVTREVFERAALATRQRGKECGTYPEKENAGQAGRRQRRYGFSGRLCCAQCGSILHRQSNGHYYVLTCAGRRRNRGGCTNGNEMEDNIKNAFLTCLNKLAYSQSLSVGSRVIDNYIRLLRDARQERSAVSSAEGEEALQRKDTLCTGTDAVFMERAEKLKCFVSRWRITGRTEDFPESSFRDLVTKATVRSEEYVTFGFACGLELTESLRRE